MKRLTALLFTGFVLTASAFGYEKDPFKLIPRGTIVGMDDVDGNGVFDFYWWDKNKDEDMTSDEVFLDLNQDGIPDITYEDLIKIYERSGTIIGRII